MKKILTFIFLFSNIASADVLSDIKTANPSATPFQVLQKLYLTAKSPADVSDFDELGRPSDMRCANAEKSSQTPRDAVVPKTYKIVIPGEPGQGPLFPDTPDMIKTIVIQLEVEPSWLAEEGFNRYVAASVLEKNATDLKLNISSDSDIDPSQSPATFFYRKNGNYIATKEIIGNTLRYTYCWRPE